MKFIELIPDGKSFPVLVNLLHVIDIQPCGIGVRVCTVRGEHPYAEYYKESYESVASLLVHCGVKCSVYNIVGGIEK